MRAYVRACVCAHVRLSTSVLLVALDEGGLVQALLGPQMQAAVGHTSGPGEAPQQLLPAPRVTMAATSGGAKRRPATPQALRRQITQVRHEAHACCMANAGSSTLQSSFNMPHPDLYEDLEETVAGAFVSSAPLGYGIKMQPQTAATAFARWSLLSVTLPGPGWGQAGALVPLCASTDPSQKP